MNTKLPTMTSDLHLMGDGYSCAFSLKDGQMNCTWPPFVPPARKLRRIIESGAYLAARHVFLQRWPPAWLALLYVLICEG